MRLLSRAKAATLLMAMSGVSQAQASRELVRLPEPMQEHMLFNMREHLATLNAIVLQDTAVSPSLKTMPVAVMAP